MTTRKMAALRVTPEVLRAMLGLPEGADVIRVESEPGFRGDLRLIIDGAGWDVHDGNPIPPARATITEHFEVQGDVRTVRRTIEWDFQKDRQ